MPYQSPESEKGHAILRRAVWLRHPVTISLALIAYIVADKAGLLRTSAPAEQQAPCHCEHRSSRALLSDSSLPLISSVTDALQTEFSSSSVLSQFESRDEQASVVDSGIYSRGESFDTWGAAEADSRMMASSSSSGSSGGGHSAHPHDAMLLLCIALVSGTLITHLTTLPALRGVQQTVVLFVTGMVLSFIIRQAKLAQHLGVYGNSYNMWMQIDPHLLLFTLLPPLVTGDAMNIDTTVARRVMKQCLFLAGPGVCINGFVMAWFLYFYLPYEWDFTLCLTSGAILCATDPVAVVALLKELGASKTLTVQIQGESLLNDGTAIVLYTISYNILKGEVYEIGDIIQSLVKMAIYAWALGMLIGAIFYLWIRAANNKFDHNSSVIQASVTICCCYSSFVVAEGALHISGVLSTVAAALILAHKMWPHVVDVEAMHDIWHMLEYLGNSIIFFLAGALTGQVMTKIEAEDYVHLLVIYIASGFIRGSLIFISRPLLDRLAEDQQAHITAADALVMTWGGLRGAIGLALAIQVEMDRANGKLDETTASRVLFYVSGIAALTLLINATTSPALVKWLGITQLPATKRKLMHILLVQLLAKLMKEPRGPEIENSIYEMLSEVDHHILHSSENVHENHTPHGISLTRPPNDVMVPSNHTRADEDSDEECQDFRLLPLRQPGLQSMIYAQVINGSKLVAEIDEIKKKLYDGAQGKLEYLRDIPEMPLLDQEEDMARLAIEYVTNPAVQRAVNEAFMSLVRSRYWQMISAREFASYDHEARHLLNSVESATAVPMYDLADFPYIETFIKESIERTRENRKSKQEKKLGFSDNSYFQVFVASMILANTGFVYLEQSIKSEDDEDGMSAWVVFEIIFQTSFTAEFFIKLYDFRFMYFLDPWNLFDFALVVIGIVGIVINLLTTYASNAVGQARLIKVLQIFRILRIVRLFRLIRFYQILRAKVDKQNINFTIAEHMQKLTIVSSFLTAHVEAQSSLVKYFGNQGKADTVEVSRAILQSQLSCYKAMILVMREKAHIPPHVIEDARVAREAKGVCEQMEHFIVDCHGNGILNSKEADNMLHVLHDNVKEFLKRILDIQAGKVECPNFKERVSTRSEATPLCDDVSDDGTYEPTGIAAQIQEIGRQSTLAKRAMQKINGRESQTTLVRDEDVGLAAIKASDKEGKGGEVTSKKITPPEAELTEQEPAPEPNNDAVPDAPADAAASPAKKKAPAKKSGSRAQVLLRAESKKFRRASQDQDVEAPGGDNLSS
jgi:NhaP-type Na+/H+ or K+/H+ antiporter